MKSTLNIAPKAVTEHYQLLNKMGCLTGDPAGGFLRRAYSAEETEVMRYFEKLGTAIGAESKWDAVGNLSLTWNGESDKFIETASHVDTVPSGGNFDGLAGVVAGFLAIEKIVSQRPKLKNGLRLRIWRSEEGSCFNSTCSGSRAAFGILNPELLANKYDGVSLEQAMVSQGANVDLIKSKTPTISQSEIDSIAAHVELHIEQGNFLEVQKIDLGIITSIRGPKRYFVALKGEFDHSGATPMGIEYRKDVNLALGYILVRLNELCQSKLKTGADMVQTVGVINSRKDFNEKYPQVHLNAVPIVSGFGYFCIDVRSISNSFLDSYCEEAQKVIKSTAAEFGVSAEISLIGGNPALETVDLAIQDAAEAGAKAQNISAMRMPSGATHDATVVGLQRRTDGTPIPVGMLFIPCRGGKSHCPEEFASDEAIAKGATVLAETLYRLAS